MDAMGTMRDLDQIREHDDGAASSRLMSLALGGLATACVLFAIGVMVGREAGEARTATRDDPLARLDQLAQQTEGAHTAMVTYPERLTGAPASAGAAASSTATAGTPGTTARAPEERPVLIAGAALPPAGIRRVDDGVPPAATVPATGSTGTSLPAAPMGAPAAVGTEGAFSVQVSSFRSQQMAQDIAARLRERITGVRAKLSAAAVMLEITNNVPAFNGMRYKELAKVERQFPDVGGADQYYGGTAYQNKGGLGLQIAAEADEGTVTTGAVAQAAPVDGEGLLLVPTTRLYDRSTIVRQSQIIAGRTAAPFVGLHPSTAERLGVTDGDAVSVAFAGGQVTVKAHVSEAYAPDAAFLPRHLTSEPTPMLPTRAVLERAASAVTAL